ncbi:CU044_2847 family protein [Acaryochloris marina]|uniref:Trypsin-co-occurring domain-containing protein n=1 Tax=Acaryochloris marina (strain MBIC 11017) TaxID=329726 RepID=A8ZQB2_ACAM1|nr:CU044_2847 family protein [Acaryochloris marina]ABW33198.1 conserved hypothetical protein [Acaryochloris marina MBIC11017]
MNKKAIAQFHLVNGTEVLFEVPKPSSDVKYKEVANGDFKQKVIEIADGAEGTLEAALSKVAPVADTVLSRLKEGLTTPANEVEVKFGVNLTAEGGVIFSTVGGQVSLEVTLKWTQN